MTQQSSARPPRASTSSRILGALLRWPIGRRWGRSLVLLRIRGRHSGALFELPVQYAVTEGGIVVVPGRPETKQWWRNLRVPSPIEVLHDGAWRPARGEVLIKTDEGYRRALDAYGERWPRVPVPRNQPLVLITWLDEL
jgi:hypothetical protein